MPVLNGRAPARNKVVVSRVPVTHLVLVSVFNRFTFFKDHESNDQPTSTFKLIILCFKQLQASEFKVLQGKFIICAQLHNHCEWHMAEWSVIGNTCKISLCRIESYSLCKN